MKIRTLWLLIPALLLASCGQQAPTQNTSHLPDEQLPDEDVPWSYQIPAAFGKLTLDPGLNTLGFEPLLSATNGYGPFETNKSNGKAAAGDGKPLTLNGTVYPTGFGVHSDSTLVYSLLNTKGATCGTFTASIGLDDEVGNNGSVVFQVLTGKTSASAAVVYDSGPMTGASATKTVWVNVTGSNVLTLRVTDAGDGKSFDHADWGTPNVTCTAATSSSFGTALDYQGVTDQPYSVSEAQGTSFRGQLYMFGGFDSTRLPNFTPTSRAYRYDPAQNTWTGLANLPGGGLTHAGITTDDKYIYLACGYIPDGGNGQIFGSRAAYRYDPAQNTYTRLPDLPADCAAGQLEFLNGKLHYFGGLDASRTRDIAAHYVLDLAGNGSQWTLAAPMPQPRNHLASVAMNGNIYAIGGQTGDQAALTTHPEVWAYDPATDAWTGRKSMAFGRGHISNSAFVMNGRIVVAGGETRHLSYVNTVTTYDPATDTWSDLSGLPELRSSGFAAAIDNGHFVYVAGNNGTIQPQKSGWKAALH